MNSMDGIFNEMHRQAENSLSNIVHFGGGGAGHYDDGPFTTGHRVPKAKHSKYEESSFPEHSIAKAARSSDEWQDFSSAAYEQPKRQDYFPRKSGLVKYDNSRRGVYVPTSLKNDQSPVNTGGARRSPYLEPLQPAPAGAPQLPPPSNPANRLRPANAQANNAASNPPRNAERTVPRYFAQQFNRAARQQAVPRPTNNNGHKARIG
eukprot:TRINITY_DN886_c0_g6_i1.p2 TRINITY_DN886_c0_g6~~TRINITY_DN886_c0_g6_i1.p2  ORF type:complete len:206 (-),score=11.64 TRINITY_DN886_c0_g6_i1:202-819(-)